MDIDDLLQSFKYFGVELGLERIKQLLSRLGNPQQNFPIIHVAGTNGKGSVCAYLSSILTQAGYRVGRYTSPHLVDWTERICLNQEPISSHTLGTILEQVKAAIPKNCSDPPTLFEVTTAAAWLYFAQQQVDVAVIEVGLGGRLDATNVCDRVLVSIITSLSWEHWQRLGPTLADIAKEKAGILKPGCPAVIGPLPPEARAVVESRVNQLGCPVVWVDSAVDLPEGKTPSTGKHLRWVEYGGVSYNLPLLGEVQLVNSAIAIATVQVLQQQGWEIPEDAIALGMAKTTWLGRLQWTSWENHHLLIDGAHNQASAQALRQYVDTLGKSVNWVMGILSTKDHAGIFNALLRPGDRLSLVPVPDHSSAELDYLATLAQQICPTLADCAMYPELVTGLRGTFNKAEAEEKITVLCGSLYLVGHFLRTEAFVGGNGNS
ncbi:MULTISPECIES: folylpolyglutamate synthase/dihydrofolate synthase family protein [Moorena]|uniref:Dihydrofolate synthase/folylpolyglutamate synthase n=1 Tax=Moorena producens 3L TaxID=489825 RepID=F4Y0C8_9CYAN|nr:MULTISPECIES: folylpolyglutamate synthase/dihydrofolate synthase family protein [Moorena]EGJ29718.1 folylpolyglutamate synthase/dihydrofolate synthase [Moorena producens 3L]NEP68153.1 bifunctional folylpolyglutamate synthase/dihydrofolate synthase [Moorena sp. SIO3A5]NEQ07328.1 bifunctional folylpolyglutamate synthase/dihydrofolate synthase [Moorena sp. SIO4E2]OLT69194.1 bifunctional folylpolyglutamate synthase/dihydrofolate synthase [Moorena producens 3L]